MSFKDLTTRADAADKAKLSANAKSDPAPKALETDAKKPSAEPKKD